MKIIGEKLNSSIPKTLEALKAHDEQYIVNLIKQQSEKGAGFIDVNTALMGEDELKCMLWIVELIKRHSDCGIMPDSPNPEVILEVLSHIDDREIIVNSVTSEKKYDILYPVLAQKGCGVVCMPMGESGFPENAQQRLSNAAVTVNRLKQAGISGDNIYVDIVVQSAATDMTGARTALETLAGVKRELGVNTVGGMSNISFGLPKRKYLNTAFLAMAMSCGLDAAILDITSEPVRAAVFASDALLGNDEYCLEYIGFTREED